MVITDISAAVYTAAFFRVIPQLVGISLEHSILQRPILVPPVTSLLTTRGRGVDCDVRETTDTKQGTTIQSIEQLNTAQQHAVPAALRMRTHTSQQIPHALHHGVKPYNNIVRSKRHYTSLPSCALNASTFASKIAT